MSKKVITTPTPESGNNKSVQVPQQKQQKPQQTQKPAQKPAEKSS